VRGRDRIAGRAGGFAADHDRDGQADDGDHRDSEQCAQVPVVGAEYDGGVLGGNCLSSASSGPRMRKFHAVVVTREHGYQLKVDPERLDSHRFERLVAEVGSELASGQPERAASALDAALSLWRGAALADFAYEPFAQPEIARLEDLRVAAIDS
jgi:hypothetical protein